MEKKGEIVFNGGENFTDEQMFKFIKEAVEKQSLNDTMTEQCLKLLDKTETKFNRIKRSNIIFKEIITFNESIATPKQKDQLIKKQMEMLVNGRV